jgi:hypothetical protein
MQPGWLYASGTGVEKDEAGAAELYAKAAERGDARGWCDLDVCYANGTGMKRMPPSLWAKAADQGDAEAQCRLGVCYEHEKGVERNDVRAAVLYAKAAEQSHAWGQCSLGACYERGTGVEKDEARAAELYAKDAEQGVAASQCSLGVCYEHGRGVERDEERAAELYAKAAEQGNVAAQSLLGSCYAFGRGVDKDGAMAMKWMRRAAEQGDPAIEAKLAELLYGGSWGRTELDRGVAIVQVVIRCLCTSKITSAWMLWGGQNGVRRDRLKAKTMCEEVLTTEDLEDQLGDWEAVGWTWPAALNWFQSEVRRADEPSGEAVERGEGESGSLQEAEGNGRGTPAHLEVRALAGASTRGASTEEMGESHGGGAAVRASAGLSREALSPGSRPKPATLRHFSRAAIIISVIVAIIAIAVAVNEKQVRDI